MRALLCLAAFLPAATILQAQAPFRIATVAGADRIVPGRPATESYFRAPSSAAVDTFGNVYVSDSRDHRIFRINPAGTLTVLAGTGEQGFSGDNGPAIAARLNQPNSLVADRNGGRLFFADQGNNRVRVINLNSGVIQTYAGNGLPEYLGIDLPADQAQFYPQAMTLDEGGNLFVLAPHPFPQRSIVVRIDGLSRQVTQVLGSAVPSSSIEITRNGTLILASATTGMFEYVSGSLTPREIFTAFSSTPAASIALDSSGSTLVYLSPSGDLRRLDLATRESALVARIPRVRILYGSAVAVDGAGNAFVVENGRAETRDESSGAIRRVEKFPVGGQLSVIAGRLPAKTELPTRAPLDEPVSLSVDRLGQLVLADSGNLDVRILDRNGQLTTFSNPETRENLFDPVLDVAIDGSDLYLSTQPRLYLFRDGSFVSQQFLSSGAIAVRSPYLYYGYGGFQAAIYRQHLTQGATSLLAGGPGPIGPETVLDPQDLGVDSKGNVYFADTAYHRVRKIDLNGRVTTVAGNSVAGFNTDAGLGINVQLNNPTGIAVDAQDRLYIADFGNGLIRRLDSNGQITTIAGTQRGGSAAPFAPALESAIRPRAIAVDSEGNVFFAETAQSRVRMLVAPNNTTFQPITTEPLRIKAGEGVRLTARLLAKGMIPLPSVPVEFSIVSGSAKFAAGSDPATVSTAADGFVTAELIAGEQVGEVLVTARTPLSNSASFRVIVEAAQPVPLITGIFGAAESDPLVRALSPQGLVTITGRSFTSGEFTANSGQQVLESSLGGVCVTVNGVNGFPVLVSPERINFQVPDLDDAAESVNVRVVTGCGGTAETTSAPGIAAWRATAPELFIGLRLEGRAYALMSDPATGAAIESAEAGRIVTFTATGLGRLANGAAGTVPQEAIPIAGDLTITLSGRSLAPEFAGAVPGSAGLYQIRVQIPEDMAAGDAMISVRVGDAASPEAYLRIR